MSAQAGKSASLFGMAGTSAALPLEQMTVALRFQHFVDVLAVSQRDRKHREVSLKKAAAQDNAKPQTLSSCFTQAVSRVRTAATLRATLRIDHRRME